MPISFWQRLSASSKKISITRLRIFENKLIKLLKNQHPSIALIHKNSQLVGFELKKGLGIIITHAIQCDYYKKNMKHHPKERIIQEVQIKSRTTKAFVTISFTFQYDCLRIIHLTHPKLFFKQYNPKKLRLIEHPHALKKTLHAKSS